MILTSYIVGRLNGAYTELFKINVCLVCVCVDCHRSFDQMYQLDGYTHYDRAIIVH